jgi:branched-chain amino acid transport system ATP-binding protein
MPGEAPALELVGVGRRFGGVIAVQDVSLRVERGSVHGLIGPNGAGKTTLLNLSAGALRPSTGTIGLDGNDITQLPPPARAAAGLARTFQNLKLFADMSVLQNAMAGAHATGKSGVFAALCRTPRHKEEERGIRNAAAEALAFVGLADFAERPASSLAYGHRRLLEIARGLASAPRLLLLDEPAAGLTRTEAKTLITLIKRVRDKGITILLVEHHMDVVMNSCTQLTVLHHGRKLAEGLPHEVRRLPEVVEAYFGSAAPAAKGGRDA